MRTFPFAVVAAVLALAGCGDVAPASGTSGVTGTVHLGPRCPVETQDQPCDDLPAAGVEVTVSERVPGETYAAGAVVARGDTDADGTFRIAVTPGSYVVTAEAGMSCELMDARVAPDRFTEIDIPCDTGIR